MTRAIFYVLTIAALLSNTPAKAQVLAPADFVEYANVKLTSESIDKLSGKEKIALKEMIQAAIIMDGLFWRQAFAEPEQLKELTSDPKLLSYAAINYGPWDRLQGNRPFIKGAGEKPLGANFYPKDMKKEEFEAANFTGKKDLYSLVRRDSEGRLYSVPYSEVYKKELAKAAAHLRKAARLVVENELKQYLLARAEALETNSYQASDLLWMDMKSNKLDIVIGPIETYEDRLFGYRAAFESYVLIKDTDWSQKLARYAAFLPELQKALPVPENYKKETPGTDSDLNAYDVLYYAGDCNAGSKTIAINLPNDEEVQLKKGSRRLQLKNAMKAKYEKIMVPIAGTLLAPEQRDLLTFEAFFSNTMFHEVAHGLGIKNVINPERQGLVDDALKELAGTLEEGKADMLGLFMIEKLTQKGEFPATNLNSQYATFLAGMFRSIRFGASSPHGIANLARFNYFKEKGAFMRGLDGYYRADFKKMAEVNHELTSLTLRFQGDGDYEGVKAFLARYAVVDPQLESDLARLKHIPTDVVFQQGIEILGL